MRRAVDDGGKKTRRRYFCAGFFGAPNVGDELLCRAVVDTLHRTCGPAHVAVQTFDVQTSAQFSGVGRCRPNVAGFGENGNTELIAGWWPDTRWLSNLGRRIRLLREIDAVVIGGGGLIEDVYSRFSLPRYVADACFALMAGRPLVFVGLGVRPVKRTLHRRLASFVLGAASAVYVRDEDSMRRARGLCGASCVEVGPDIAVLYDPSPPGSVIFSRVLANLRETPDLDLSGATDLLAALVAENGAREGPACIADVVLLAAETNDVNLLEKLASKLQGRGVDAIVVWPRSLDEVNALLHGAGIVVAERLHVTHLALVLGRPLLPVVYEPKVDFLLDEFSFEGVRCTPGTLGRTASSMSPGQAWGAETVDPARIANVRALAERAFVDAISAARKGQVSPSIRLRAAGWFALMLVIALAFAPVLWVRRRFAGTGRERLRDRVNRHRLRRSESLEAGGKLPDTIRPH